jgi:hypothetical protein
MTQKKVKKILFGLRRPEHLPYIQNLIEEFTLQGFDVYLILDAKYSKKENISNLFYVERVLFGNTNPSNSRLKNLAGCLAYLCDAKFEKEYFTRHLHRSQLSIFYRVLLWSLAKCGKKNRKQIAFTYIKKIRKTMSIIDGAELDHQVSEFNLVVCAAGNFYNSFEDSIVAAANRLQIPSVVISLSLDNLNSKGTVGSIPSLYFVWNTLQSTLASERHLIPSNRIRVVGSLYHDKLLSNLKYNERQVENIWCVDKPFIMYLGSSSNIIQNESEFLHALLNSQSEFLEFFEIKILPHPANHNIWNTWEYPGTSILKAHDQLILRDFEELSGTYRAAKFALGLNTSAFIDAIAFDCPVGTIESLDALHQVKTRHWSFLVDSGIPKFNNFMEAKEAYDTGVFLNITKSVHQILLPNMRHVARICANECQKIVAMSKENRGDFS